MRWTVPDVWKWVPIAGALDGSVGPLRDVGWFGRPSPPLRLPPRLPSPSLGFEFLAELLALLRTLFGAPFLFLLLLFLLLLHQLLLLFVLRIDHLHILQ